MVTQYRFKRYFFSQRLAQLQLGKHRGLVQPAAQVHRKQTEHTAQQEWNTPGEVRDFGRGVDRVDGSGHQRAQQNTGRQAAGQGAAGVANVTRRHVLRNKNPCSRYFATNGRALDHPHQQQQDRRQHADLLIRRQQPHDQRRHSHHENAQGEHLFAPQQVAEVRHDDATQGPCQVTRGKNAKGLHQA